MHVFTVSWPVDVYSMWRRKITSFVQRLLILGLQNTSQCYCASVIFFSYRDIFYSYIVSIILHISHFILFYFTRETWVAPCLGVAPWVVPSNVQEYGPLILLLRKVSLLSAILILQNYIMAFEDMVSFKSKIEACVTGIDSWMIINKLKMDSDKTEILVFSSSHRPRPALDLLDIVQRMCVTQFKYCKEYWGYF